MSLNLSEAWLTIQGLLNGFIAMLPRLGLAVIIVALSVAMGKLFRSLVRRHAMRRGEGKTLEIALGRLSQVGIISLGVLIAVTAAFPSFTPANLVSTLGIGGVAIGFAFKDIFQNFLAGILILVTRPFQVGDQIRFKEYEGTVEDIQTRATFIKTYDGRRAIIPNGELYTNSVLVNTAFLQRRWQYDIGIGYGDDIERARGVILQALQQAEDVSPDPGADVILVELADFTVNLRARWWTKSKMTEGLNAQDRVLTRVKHALSEAGIDLPFPTQQILFHDQTEATDGNRGRQREGWPAGSGEVPKQVGAGRVLARAARSRTTKSAGANGGAEESRDAGAAAPAAPPPAG